MYITGERAKDITHGVIIAWLIRQQRANARTSAVNRARCSAAFQARMKQKMAGDSKTFICRPEDQQRLVLKSASRLIDAMLESGWVDVTISRHVDKKTPPQHRTVWLWCTEAASQLTEMGRMTGKGGTWKREDVYEIVMKGRFMPKREKVMPDGTVEYVPVGLSAKPTIEQVSEAMEKFQAWAAELGIELTQPEELG